MRSRTQTTICAQITGVNFGVVAGEVTVSVGGRGCVVAALTDALIECWTPARAGAVVVTVAGQRSGPLAFNASEAVVVPVLGAVSGDGAGMGLARGALLRITGSGLALRAPSVAVVLALDDAPAGGGGGGGGVEDASEGTLCARARAVVRAGRTSDWCTSLALAGADLLCAAPPSRRAAARLVVVAVALTSCRASGPWRVRYAPPVLLRLRGDAGAVLLLPTAGGAVVYADGANLEEGMAIVIGGAVCVTLVVNSSTARVVTPVGAGAGVRMGTISPAYGALPQPPLLAYRPPVISRVAAHGGDTAGGNAVVIEGGDLAPDARVWIGGAPARVVSVDDAHTRLSVASPPGVGAGLPVNVSVAGQSGLLAAGFSYLPPVVIGINVTYVDALRGGAVTVAGAQFGAPGGGRGSGGLTVTVHDRECIAPVVTVPHGTITCRMPPGLPVGFTGAVTVRVGGQAGSWPSAVAACPPRWYGRDGEYCAACPRGADCAGGAHDPVPTAGWARVSRAVYASCVPAGACVALAAAAVEARLARGAGEAEAYFNCAAGYADEACGACAERWYRRGLDCVPCPSYAAGLIGTFVVFLALCGAAVWYLQKRLIVLKGLTIGVDLFQTLSLFQVMRYPFPPAAETALRVCQLSTISVELVAPQCTVRFSYFQLWAATALVPPVTIGVLACVLAFVVAARACRAACAAPRRSGDPAAGCLGALRAAGAEARATAVDAADALVGGTFTLLYYTCAHARPLCHSMHDGRVPECAGTSSRPRARWRRSSARTSRGTSSWTRSPPCGAGRARTRRWCPSPPPCWRCTAWARPPHSRPCSGGTGSRSGGTRCAWVHLI